jgi:hypothetical protein
LPEQYGATRPWSANSGALSGDQVLPANAYSEILDDLAGDYPLVVASGDLVALSAGAILELSVRALKAESTLAQSLYDANHDVLLIPGATTQLWEDPFVIESGSLVSAPPGSLLWTDAARAPQIIPTLLWIIP